MATNGMKVNSTLSSNTIVTVKTETTSSAESRHPVPTKSLPAWATPITKALSEQCAPPENRTPTPSVDSAAPKSGTPKSIPPHLRKLNNTGEGIPTKPLSCESRVADDKAVSPDSAYEAACKASQHVSDPTIAQMQAYLEAQNVEGGAATKSQRPGDPMIIIDQVSLTCYYVVLVIDIL
ncbi:hypothetical protein IQ06DRAFT_73436 [Phaeosphaeriaceae sp. SRC1lsM3a]|nr:hypothetical protein IQ06DRAFT_73436 [Stagonospora sp. SRC1lsM3a]